VGYGVQYRSPEFYTGSPFRERTHPLDWEWLPRNVPTMNLKQTLKLIKPEGGFGVFR